MKTSRCNLSIPLRVKIDRKCQKLIRGTVHLGTTVLLNLEIIAFFVVKWILCCYPEAAIKDFIVASRKHKVILYVSIHSKCLKCQLNSFRQYKILDFD